MRGADVGIAAIQGLRAVTNQVLDGAHTPSLRE